MSWSTGRGCKVLGKHFAKHFCGIYLSRPILEKNNLIQNLYIVLSCLIK